MTHDRSSPAIARAAALETVPALLTVARRLLVTALDAADPEIDELRRLLDARVVGAHRLRLGEQIRAKGACESR
jgi:hypothetical protein